MLKSRQDAWQPGSTLLRLGIAAARAGHKSDARQFFRQLLRLNPHHELAWMWMGGVVGTDAERVHCLRQVLLLDPDNVPARRGLEKIEARMATAWTEAQPPSPPEARPREGGDREGGARVGEDHAVRHTCPHCGTQNRETSSFCTECGRRLTERPTLPAPPPSPPPPKQEPQEQATVKRELPTPASSRPTPDQRADRGRVLLTIVFVLLLLMLVTVCSVGACLICRTWDPSSAVLAQTGIM